MSLPANSKPTSTKMITPSIFETKLPVADQSQTAINIAGADREFVQRLRTTSVDDLGQPAVRFTSPDGGEPLRDLLRRARPGEDVILGSYSLFKEAGPFREIGPIYISAQAEGSASNDDIFESDYLGAELVVRAYSPQRWIYQAQRVGKSEARDMIRAWLSDARTLFVDARFPTYGCFACRFTRP